MDSSSQAAHRPRRSVILAVAAAVASAGLAIAYLALGPSSPPSARPKPVAAALREPAAESLPPSLDCAFNAFMHSSTAVSFYFDVAMAEGAPPRFYERAFVSADGVRQAFEGADRPTWTYGLDDDGKPTITSSDGGTRIVLYGLKLGSPGILPVEAGMRSNVFRNLGGHCRQTNLRVAAK